MLRWLRTRLARGVEKGVETLLWRLIATLLTVALAGLAYVGVVAFDFALRHASLAMQILIALASALSGASITVAAVGLKRARTRTVELGLRDKGFLEEQYGQLGYGTELVYQALELLQHDLASDDELSIDDLVVNAMFPMCREFFERGIGEHVALSVLWPSADRSHFVMRWSVGHSRHDLTLPIEGSFAGEAFESGDLLWSDDTASEPQFLPYPPSERPYRSIVAVPIHTGTDVAGVFNVVSTYESAFTRADVLVVRQIGAVLDVVTAWEHDHVRRGGS